MSDHPVKRKLRNDILPYIVTARRLHRQWFCVLHIVFGYTTDLLVALTAIGVVSPALSAFLATPQVNGSENLTITSLIATVPKKLYYLVISLIIGWVILRVAFNREEGQKKAVLAKSCRLAMRQAEAKLPRVLDVPDPMPGIIKIYEEVLMPTVDRGVPDGAWPWTPFAPGIDGEVERQLSELCQKYESQWAPVDPIGMRGVLPARGGQL